MNRQELLQLNAIPEGKPAWLSHDHHNELRRLFDALPLPQTQSPEAEMAYARMHHFLNDVAQVTVPFDAAAIHFNAFVLIRRGCHVEEISRSLFICGKHMRRRFTFIGSRQIAQIGNNP